MPDLPFSCRCGSLTGTLHDASPSSGTHLSCFCASCRAAARHTGEADPTDQGVKLFQSTPDKVSFDRGVEHLAAFSFGPKNILRWQASCCGASLFNTLRTPKIAMAVMVTARLDDTAPLGPEKCRAFVPLESGKSKHEGALRLMGGMLWRALMARVTGAWKQTPFFDVQTGTPVVPVTVISKDERRALLG